MDEKEFFARLAAVGPDGKFSSVSRKKSSSVQNQGDLRQAEQFKLAKSSESNPISVDLELEKDSGNNGEDVEIKKSDEEKENSADNVEIFEGPEGQLTIDVYQTPVSIIVESAVAGVEPEDIDIEITPDSVAIKGKRIKKERVDEKDYLYSECFWGRFSRSIILPQEIDAEKAHASLKNGILKIILPKVNRQKAKKLKVKFS
ncbi:MAG: Hsp20/alpha crystallin family protein [Patescibacteria group bacterium]